MFRCDGKFGRIGETKHSPRRPQRATAIVAVSLSAGKKEKKKQSRLVIPGDRGPVAAVKQQARSSSETSLCFSLWDDASLSGEIRSMRRPDHILATLFSSTPVLRCFPSN